MIEFEEGQFSLALHAHVYACGTEALADKVVETLKPLSDAAILKDINREHDGQA